MFGAAAGLASLGQAMAEADMERRLMEEMPDDVREIYRERRERQRLEAIAERRHKELCESVRSTSFWRFGA